MKKTLTPLHRSGGRSRTGRWFINVAAKLSVIALLAVMAAGLVTNSSAASTLLIPTNQTWRYIVPTDNAFCLDGTGWETTAFDDSAWAGPSPGGFTAETTAATLTSLAGWLGTTTLPAPAALLGRPYYFRTHFNLTSTDVNLYFTNRVDDQAVWYINGVRVASLAHDTNPEVCPPQAPGGGEATTNYVFTLTMAQLAGIIVVGDNVLAVSVHQNATGSSDIVFGTTVSEEIVLPDSFLTITDNPDSVTVDERAPASFTVAATGAPQFYHWSSNGVPILGETNATYSIASAHFSANGAVFTCIVSNGVNSPTSAAATLTVTPDLTAPTILSAVATTPSSITLNFSEPMNPLYADTGSFIIYETGTVPGSVTPASAIVNGSTITLTLVDPLTDGVLYSVQIYDVYDTSVGAGDPGNGIDPYPSDVVVRRLVPLVLTDFDGPNNVWKFTNGVFGTGWETTGYDDANWAVGEVGIGRDASVNGVPIRTPAYPANDGTPYFFRRHVYLPADTAGVTLSIRHVFEDGAVVFINGQEAGRYQVPAGTLTAATLSSGALADPTPISASVPLGTNGLVQGDNVIAVVVYQSSATSSDMEFAMELTANVLLFAAGPPSSISPPASQSVNEGANVSFSVTADGALPLSYQWNRNGSPILDATNSSYSIVGVLPSQAGNYHVTVSNGQGSSNSAIATLTVTPDTTAPVFASAIGAANLTNITLNISDAFGLNQTAAETEANYSVALTAGGGSLVIESAVLVNATTVLLTTSPRALHQNYTVTLSGIVDRSEASNVATPSSRPVQATVILMDYNHVWRYDETGNDLGSTWSNVGYDDSGWLSGAGFLTFETSVGPLTLFTNLAGGNGSNTVLNLTNQTLGGISGTNITYYFRATVGSLPFDPNTPGNIIRAHSYFDDGGVVYVNGSEQVRYNLTNSPVALNYTNLAIAGSTEGAGGIITSNVTGFLQAGNNLVAAEVHQNAMTSSDVAWGMQIEALVTTFGAGCPTLKIVDNGNGTVTISWTGAATLEETTALQTPSASTIWNPSARVNGVPFTPGADRFYRLSCP